MIFYTHLKHVFSCPDIGFCLFSWQMYGLVGWPYMLCWWEHIHLRTKKIQRISEKPLMYVYLFNWPILTGFTFSPVLNYMVFFSFFFHYTMQRIMAVQYKIPDYVHISQDCRHLLSRIFVANPARVCCCLGTLNNFLLKMLVNVYKNENRCIFCED